jgi:uncharacterized protein YukE
MKHAAYLWSGVILCVVSIVVLVFKINDLESKVRGLTEANGPALTTLQDSLTRMQADAQTAKDLAPGLGEYMTTIQLHAGKLWFAAKATNWPLAEYELDELKETMKAAKALNAEKNGVKISNVLDSVLQTQVAQLAASIKRKSSAEFQSSYDETLSACNGCHTEAGYKFIQIVRPNSPPVTNQKW